MRPVEGVLIVAAILLLFIQLSLQQFIVFPCWMNHGQTKCLAVLTATMIRGRNRHHRRFFALGLYRLGHENSCVSIGPKKAHSSHDLRPWTRIELPAHIIFHETLTSVDSCCCDYHCLVRLFENLPAPPKHYGVFDVLPFRKVFAKRKNLGSH